MAMMEELIRVEEEGILSFGNYLLTQKTKVENFNAFGHTFKVKSFEEMTRLEKDDNLLFEAVPGVAVYQFTMKSNDEISFQVEGQGDTQITLELEPNTEYKLYIQSMLVSKVKSNAGGKVIFSVEAGNGRQKIKLERV